MDGQERRLKYNFIYNILYQASIYITPLITAPYLSRVLGAEQIGHYSFAQSIVSFFILFATLGTTYYGQRQIALVSKSPRERTRVFFEVVALRLITTAICFVAFLLAVVPSSADSVLYTIAALEILSVGLDISWFFQGMEHFGIIALTNIAAKLLSVVLIFIMVRTGDQLNLYVLLYCGTILLGFLCQWFFLKGQLGGWTSGGIQAWLREELHILKVALGLFIAQIAIQVYTVLDKAMIGWLTHSDLQNGLYEQGQKLIRILVGVSTAVGTVMASRVAHLRAEEKEEEIRELILFSFRIVCCISLPILVVIQLCADIFVPWFYSSGFEGVEPLLRILSVLPFIIGCSSVVGMQYLVPTGREKYLTISVTAGSIVNVILNLFFIVQLQSVGAAIASVIAEIIVTGIQFYIVRKEISLRRIPGIAVRYLLYCIPMAAAGFGMRLLAGQVSWCPALVIGACCVIYLIELIIFHDPLVSFFRKK